MSDQKGTIRTTVYLPRDLHKKAKEAGINNFSDWVKKSLEFELYGDNPRFIEGKLRNAMKDKQQREREIEQLREDLEKANNKQQERKERLQQFKPDEVKTYRKITPKGDK